MGPRDSGAATSPATSGSGLLEKLLAAVRPQFRVDVYVPDPQDRVLGTNLCAVPGCDRSAKRLCSSHDRRWRSRGCPDMAEFFADPGPPLHGRTEPGGCTVHGCHYGTSGWGLCLRHRGAWTSAGRPDPRAWAVGVPAVEWDRPPCRLPFCTLWTENDNQIFCSSHATRWRQLGSPGVEEFIAHCELRGRARIDFGKLAGQLKLEVQYAVQCRHDEQTITTPPAVVTWAIRQANDAAVSSLLDHSEARWRLLTGPRRRSFEAFLIYAHDVVEMLRDGTGWEVEYDRDIWRLHTLTSLTHGAGRAPHPRNNLRFDRIAQPC